MTTSVDHTTARLATDAGVTDESLIVELSDGRSISALLAWDPRLLHATPQERRKRQLIAHGEGIRWPDVDEDISVAALIAGRPSAANAAPLQLWLAQRKG